MFFALNLINGLSNLNKLCMKSSYTDLLTSLSTNCYADELAFERSRAGSQTSEIKALQGNLFLNLILFKTACVRLFICKPIAVEKDSVCS